MFVLLLCMLYVHTAIMSLKLLICAVIVYRAY